MGTWPSHSNAIINLSPISSISVSILVPWAPAVELWKSAGWNHCKFDCTAIKARKLHPVHPHTNCLQSPRPPPKDFCPHLVRPPHSSFPPYSYPIPPSAYRVCVLSDRTLVPLALDLHSPYLTVPLIACFIFDFCPSIYFQDIHSECHHTTWLSDSRQNLTFVSKLTPLILQVLPLLKVLITRKWWVPGVARSPAEDSLSQCKLQSSGTGG